MRPAAAMLLCTCIAFSAAASYIPPVSAADASAAVSSEAEIYLETASQEETKEPETVEETEEAKIRDLTAPAPYRLNFANMHEEDSGESYAEILMKELIVRDSQWYAQIYDMANMAPSKLASRLGRSKSQVTGQYNPSSKTQDPNDPASWTVEHFKNVRVSFYDGDGNITSAVSNAQQIISMASVYCYYNGIEDLEQIRGYVNRLWSASHSYSAAMGDVYYCNGCVHPDQKPEDEEDDGELEGEDYFNGESTINTEITIKESGAASGENGEEISSESDGTGEGADGSGSSDDYNSASGMYPGSGGAVTVPPTEKTTPAFSGTTVAVERTTSPLDRVVETAESVYYEETKPKVVIVRPGESSLEESKPASAETSASKAAEPKPAESQTSVSKPSEPKPAEPQTTAARPAESGPTAAEIVRPSAALEPSSAEGKPSEESPAAETSPEKRPAAVIVPVETTASGTKKTPAEEAALEAVPAETVASLETAASGGEELEYKVHAAAVTQTAKENTGESALICPGHIDLKITAKVYSLDEAVNLYTVDQAGNTAGEESGWTGWNERAKAFVSHIDRQDWTDVYDLSVIVEGTKAPLSSTEIESYMNQLPDDTSEERKEIIRFALQSVGKVPYYWGGKPSTRNYSGNNFGSLTIPDHRGRILKGLDCSGWINWVYWSVTGTRLPYEGTEGLKSTGRQISRSDLKPGDIIVITGNTPHVIMFLSWAPNGQIRCIHETGSVNNVTVGIMNANWPYYRNLLD